MRINFTESTLTTLKRTANCSYANAVYKLTMKAQQGLKCDDIYKKSVLMHEVNKLLCKYKLDSCITFYSDPNKSSGSGGPSRGKTISSKQSSSEECVEYTEEQLNCITPDDLQVLYEFTHKYKETAAKTSRRLTTPSSTATTESSNCCTWGSITGNIGNQSDLVNYLASVQKNMIAVDDEGTEITNDVKSINFIGDNVTATSVNGDVTVTITGGGSTGGVQGVTSDNTIVTINNSDPTNPVVQFNGVSTDPSTISGNGIIGSPLAVSTTVTDAITALQIDLTNFETTVSATIDGISATEAILESQIADLQSITFDNGLHKDATVVKLGGTLIEDTTIESDTFTTTLESSTLGSNKFLLNVKNLGGSSNGSGGISIETNIKDSVVNKITSAGSNSTALEIDASVSGGKAIYAETSTNTAIEGSASSNGCAVYGNSISGYGGFFQTITGPIGTFIFNSTGDNVAYLQSNRASGVGLINDALVITRNATESTRVNTGTAITKLLTTNGSGSTGRTASKYITQWTDNTDASRTSQYILKLSNSAVLQDCLTVQGNGKVIFNKYGIGTFSSTPTYLLGVNGSNEVVETENVVKTFKYTIPYINFKTGGTFTILPAPGTGYAYVVIEASVKLDYRTTPWSSGAALKLYTGPTASFNVNSSFFVQTSTAIGKMIDSTTSATPSPTVGNSIAENTALTATVGWSPGATTGDSDVIIYGSYRIITL